MTTGRRVRVGAYAVCLDEAGRVLLVRVAGPGPAEGTWMLPGGGLELGEDPEAGALRELEEETGLTGRVESLLGVVSKRHDAPAWANGDDVHNLSLLYLVTAADGALRDEVDGSTQSCSWVPIDEVDRLDLWEVAREGIRLARQVVPA